MRTRAAASGTARDVHAGGVEEQRVERTAAGDELAAGRPGDDPGTPGTTRTEGSRTPGQPGRRAGRWPYGRRPRPRSARGPARTLAPYVLLAPALASIVLLLGYPVLQVVLISLRKLDLGELVRGETVWVGFANYAATLSDPKFWAVVVRTVAFAGTCVALTMAVGLGIALLLQRVRPAVRLTLQLSLVLAWAVPVLTATTLFQWLFDQRFGVVNKTLAAIGFEGMREHAWFSTGLSTFAVIVLLVVWQAVPFVALSLYAGLLAVPGELYEAARVDGAGAWQTFRAIAWPALRPLAGVLAFLSLIWDFRVFTQIWAIRQGGPRGETTTLAVYQYLEGIAGGHFGRAAAISVLMLLVLAILTAQYLRMVLRTAEEDL